MKSDNSQFPLNSHLYVSRLSEFHFYSCVSTTFSHLVCKAENCITLFILKPDHSWQTHWCSQWTWVPGLLCVSVVIMVSIIIISLVTTAHYHITGPGGSVHLVTSAVQCSALWLLVWIQLMMRDDDPVVCTRGRLEIQLSAPQLHSCSYCALLSPPHLSDF